ncbi:MAG: B-box zinc finger protein [Candidatus Lokiarchaeota archaeon]|nr:B-box zinc finger protein [Candidatus Lokiarchaeota archaeon]
MSDYYENLCPFCENNLLLSFYCEDCNAVFCNDCVHYALTDELVCASCGSKEISMANMAALECKQCHSRHITTVQKQIKTCPNCSSNSVTKIVDKFDLLRNRFKHIITASKQFLTPLVYAVDTISIQKEKLIRLREDSVQICHFPRLEMDILQLVKLFKEGKHSIQTKTGDFFQHINRNFKTYFEIEKTQPRLIPVLEAELESLEKSAEHILSYGDYTNEKLEEKLSQIRTKIDFMSSLQRLFMRYISILSNTMEYNEKAVFGIRAKLGDSNQADTDGFVKNGTVLLTNRKLYFLQEKGIFKKKTHLVLILSLDELTRLRQKGFIIPKLVLEFGEKRYCFQLGKKNLAQLETYIEKARVFDNNKIDKELLYGLKHIDVSIQEFRNALESAIISLIGYKTAILEQEDPFSTNQFDSSHSSLENLYQTKITQDFSEFASNGNKQTSYGFTSSNNPYHRQSNYSSQDIHNPNLTTLYDIYQKRAVPEQTPEPDPAMLQYHKHGTISNPYNLNHDRSQGLNSGFKGQCNINPQHYQYIGKDNPNFSMPTNLPKNIKTSYPLRTKTHSGSIINNLMSVLPDESPHIPPPREIQQQKHIPEIDVSTLVPEQEYPEKLLRMEERYSWLQRKLDILNKQRDQGKLSEIEYLRLYEEAYMEMYRVERHIEEFKKLNYRF